MLVGVLKQTGASNFLQIAQCQQGGGYGPILVGPYLTD